MKKSLIIIGVICMGLFSAFGGKKTKSDDELVPMPRPGISVEYDSHADRTASNGHVIGFYYHYNGTIGGNDYTYQVEKDGDKFILTYESMEHRDYDQMKTELDEKFMAGLDKLYFDNCLYKWNTYHGVDRECLDGWGFSLSVQMSDGKNMYASGSNMTPNGFREFGQQMSELFKPVVEELKNQKKKEIISKGFTGKCDFLMVNFKQQGKSGSDSYSMLISEKGVRKPNFEVTIKSENGEIFPVGEKRYYCEVDNDIIDFDRLTELIKKYKIINWYNFEESDPDYNNKEWFQVEFSFDRFSINAHGTKHPENYDPFRKQLLLWLKDIIQKGNLK